MHETKLTFHGPAAAALSVGSRGSRTRVGFRLHVCSLYLCYNSLSKDAEEEEEEEEGRVKTQAWI
jgi:hypothetical protein